MDAGTQSHSEHVSEPDTHQPPVVSVCESCPGKNVFIESGNTDGWIATDLTAEVTQ